MYEILTILIIFKDDFLRVDKMHPAHGFKVLIGKDAPLRFLLTEGKFFLSFLPQIVVLNFLGCGNSGLLVQQS
jgi:hypothetical protein